MVPTPIKQLGQLLKPFWARMLGAGVLGAATIFANIGLLATSAVLISLAALMPPILDLMVLIVGVRFFGISRALCRYGERYVTHDIALRILSQLRVDIYQTIEPLAPAGLKGYGNSQLFNRLTSDIETLKYFYLKAVAVPLVAVIVIVVSSLFVFQFSPWAAMILLILTITGGIVIPLVVRKISKGHIQQHSNDKERFFIIFSDFIKGLAELQITGAQRQYNQQLEWLQNAMRQQQLRLGHIHNMTTNVITYLSHLALWGSLLVTIPLVAGGAIKGIYLAMVILVVWACFEAIIPFPQAAIQLEQSLTAAKRIFNLKNEQDLPKDDAEEVMALDHYALCFEQVDFGYQAEQLLYQQLSLTIPEGAKVAIVGSSGSGKSTLINLILKFWQPLAGKITLGGYDCQQLSAKQIRSTVAVVSQEPYLFNATIRENLLLANGKATDEMLYWALEQASLLETVQGFAQGIETYVGENGMKLSGGQRQRLAVARMFLQDSPIIILDEATQSLDTITTADILKRINQWSQEKTVITITHNLGQLKEMDCIYVFDHGRLREAGTEQMLLDNKQQYYHMWQIERQQIMS